MRPVSRTARYAHAALSAQHAAKHSTSGTGVGTLLRTSIQATMYMKKWVMTSAMMWEYTSSAMRLVSRSNPPYSCENAAFKPKNSPMTM